MGKPKQKHEWYATPDDLRTAITGVMKGKRYRLDCGHYIKLGESKTNMVVLNNGKEPVFVCTACC